MRPRRAPPAVTATALGAVAIVSGLGCERLGVVPRLDGAPFARRDAGALDLAGLDRDEGAFVRPPTPRLPPVDREVTLPFDGPVVTEELEVESDVGTLDVFFSIDTTGSFGGEIDELQAELRGRIVPELRSRVADVAFGVGRFEDFGVAPFGAEGDAPFRLLTPITSDEAAVSSAVASLDRPLGDGGDVEEAGAEALYQIATGEGFDPFVEPYDGEAARGGGTEGGVGFRPDALRVVVHVTDAPSHRPAAYAAGGIEGTRGWPETIEALSAVRAHTVGIASGAPARPDLERVAVGTGAWTEPEDGACPTGVDGAERPPQDGRCPLVFDVRDDGSGLASAVVDGITGFLDTVRYAEVYGESDDGLGFVQAIEAVEATGPVGIERADRRPAEDGILDTFVDAPPGVTLRFRAVLRNTRIPPADYDQIFRITVRVVGDGITLATRTLRVVVPFGRLDAGTGQVDGG
ncbi:MAG: hypothetical protein ACFCGT_03620 [Sandaracinaceae bacterium]